MQRRKWQHMIQYNITGWLLLSIYRGLANVPREDCKSIMRRFRFFFFAFNEKAQLKNLKDFLKSNFMQRKNRKMYITTNGFHYLRVIFFCNLVQNPEILEIWNFHRPLILADILAFIRHSNTFIAFWSILSYLKAFRIFGL